MSRKNSINKFLSRNSISLLWILTVLFLTLSFFQFNFTSVSRETRRTERRLQKKEALMNLYIRKALETPENEWLPFEEIPEDIIIYRYIDDTLKSWVNEFHINNDHITTEDDWYRIHDLNNTNLLSAPLAYLSDGVQYMNLGATWYMLKKIVSGDQTIIAGLKIKTKYPSRKSFSKEELNRYLRISSGYTTTTLYIDSSHIVHSTDGTPLFSIVSTTSVPKGKGSMPLRWFSFLLAISAMFVYQIHHKDKKSFLLTLGGLGIIEIGAFIMTLNIPANIEIFSPMLYAGSNFTNSLGKMLISHAFVALYCTSAFISRNALINSVSRKEKGMKRLLVGIMCFIIAALCVYIHLTLKSIIQNSNIVLDLYRINMISGYTILIYIAYALLFLSLLFLIYLLIGMIRFNRKTKLKISIFSPKFLFFYTLTVSIYTTVTLSLLEFRKEYENLRILTSKLAVERDLSLEIQLQAIEKHIMTDPLIKNLIGIPNTDAMILNRLTERYFWNIFKDYSMKIAICRPDDAILTEDYSDPVHCYSHYHNILEKYGIRLSNESAFYFLDYFRNRISYLGAFSILKGGNIINLYIEIDSKRTQDDIGYPTSLIDGAETDPAKIPDPYSLAKYHEGHITSHSGNYTFPITFDNEKLKEGFSFKRINNTIHFFNKISSQNLIVVNRPHRSIFMYLIFFSYVFLFLSLNIFGISWLMDIKKKKKPNISLPKRSFRMKITILLTASMIFALVFMAVGTVILIIRYVRSHNMGLMEEKIVAVQTSLNKLGNTSKRYYELDRMEVFNTMDMISKNNQLDINLFNPSGRLIKSTKPEVFNEYLVSARMDYKAYYKLTEEKRQQVVQEETISGIRYYSMYTPIYNDNGILLGIVNIPYFINDFNFKYDASSIIAAIINLYIILMIISLLIGIAMSNSLSKPLKEISRSMKQVDISHKAEHINYKENNELGMLVRNYNKMIDDLDRSTKALAQNEREEAWREMARQIAHEIKNPLTPMRLSIQHLVRMKNQGTPDWEKKIEPLAASLIEQIDILSNTASEFSSYAKFYNEEITEIDLVEIIQEQKILFESHEGISVEFVSDLEKAPIMSRKSQITRALVNLISNATQALENEETDEGIIRITLTVSGEYFKTDIEDNGPGVPEENLSRLFSPNFTTKTKGSGLGLAICRSIVTQSHGEIYYRKSEDLGGAEFTIMLPRHEDFDVSYRLDT